ncbi:MAG: riboflavin synthase [Candidatus Omnitrophica bacterium]|nr:riboflavin synthase [Candidatus Omnitrophota bacterium]MCG2702816.1 riboflavin synthase [Candidatus Omnitrophota bacterium]
MFTGIIEEIGIIEKIVKGKLMHFSVRAQTVLKETKIGDSISVNGVCLTVVSIDNKRVAFEVMRETQEKTSLKFLRVGDGVNLERAMSVHSRFGGHIVSGHIDGIGAVRDKVKHDEACWLSIEADKSILAFLVTKGSIAIDGVSLTVVDVYEHYFRVSLIPHTIKSTTLGFKKPSDKVNLEIDMLAKYVSRYFEMHKEEKPKLSEGYLRSLGFDE